MTIPISCPSCREVYEYCLDDLEQQATLALLRCRHCGSKFVVQFIVRVRRFVAVDKEAE